MLDRLVPLDELLDRLGCRYAILMREVKEGRLPPARRFGRKLFWTETEITEFIETLPREWPRGRGRPRKNSEVLSKVEIKELIG